MKRFIELKTRTKLFIGFSFITLFTIAIFVVGLLGLNSANVGEPYAFIMIILVAAAVVLSILLGILTARVINLPVKKLRETTKALAAAIASGKLFERADVNSQKGIPSEILKDMNDAIDFIVNDINNLPSPVMRIDKEFNITFINKNGADAIGRNQNDLLGTKCYDGFNTDDCKTKNCACNRAMISKKVEESECTARPQDVDIEIKYIGAPTYKDGEVSGALEVVTDVTAVKRAKQLAEERGDAMKQLLIDVDNAASQVAEGTQQVSGGSQEISQGASEQASSLEELSASITQISEQTQQNAANANKANELSTTAKNSAANGNEQMKAMQNAMQDINQSSENISKIIKVIDDIAFQTNILALNAAVEAARAGIHGKGFAVVAEEVRNLAAKSANAAKETTDLIEGSIQKVEAGTKISDETAKALESIVDSVEQAVELVNGIAVACNEQAAGVNQVNKGIEQLSQVVQTNSATAQEAAAAAEELSSQADTLKNMVGQFKFNDGAESGSAAPVKDNTQATDKKSKKEVKIKLDDKEFGKY